MIEKTFHAGDKCEAPNLEQKQMQYSYKDEDFYYFMDNVTYDMLPLTIEQTGDASKWIIDEMMMEILFHNEKAITVEAPAVAEYTVVETPPNFKGDSEGGKKPATLDSGAVIQVPFHILEGTKIRVDTKEAKYIEKVK